jgi:hypothetical protein
LRRIRPCRRTEQARQGRHRECQHRACEDARAWARHGPYRSTASWSLQVREDKGELRSPRQSQMRHWQAPCLCDGRPRCCGCHHQSHRPSCCHRSRCPSCCRRSPRCWSHLHQSPRRCSGAYVRRAASCLMKRQRRCSTCSPPTAGTRDSVGTKVGNRLCMVRMGKA